MRIGVILSGFLVVGLKSQVSIQELVENGRFLNEKHLVPSNSGAPDTCPVLRCMHRPT